MPDDKPAGPWWKVAQDRARAEGVGVVPLRFRKFSAVKRSQKQDHANMASVAQKQADDIYAESKRLRNDGQFDAADRKLADAKEAQKHANKMHDISKAKGPVVEGERFAKGYTRQAAEYEKKTRGLAKAGPVVGGEKFAPGYTMAAAKHEQSTRQGSTETGKRGGRYYVSKSGTKVYVK